MENLQNEGTPSNFDQAAKEAVNPKRTALEIKADSEYMTEVDQFLKHITEKYNLADPTQKERGLVLISFELSEEGLLSNGCFSGTKKCIDQALCESAKSNEDIGVAFLNAGLAGSMLGELFNK